MSLYESMSKEDLIVELKKVKKQLALLKDTFGTSSVEGKSERVKRLREQAEASIDRVSSSPSDAHDYDRDSLLHELHVYQVELEMQNDELRLSENRLVLENAYKDALFQKSPIGYVVITACSKICEINPAAEALFAYPHELIDIPLTLFMTKEQARVFEEALIEVQNGFKVTREVQYSRFNESTTRWLSISISSLNPPIIAEQQYLCSLIDITQAKHFETNLVMAKKALDREVDRQTKELQKANQKLQESEERQRTLFEQSRDALMTLATDPLRFTSANAACLAMFGLQDEFDFIGLNPFDLSPDYQPDGSLSADKALELISVAMRDGSCFFEWKHQKVNGEAFIASVLLTKIVFRGETILQATLRDITQRKEDEIALLQQRAFDASLAKCATQLLAEMSSKEDTLEEILTILLKTVDAERIYIFCNETDQQGRLCMSQTHEVCSPSVSQEVDNQDLQMLPYEQGFIRWRDLLSKRHAVSGPVSNFPHEEQDILISQDIQSLLVLPLWVHGRWCGFIGLDDTKGPRKWTEDEISFLQTAADMVGASLGARQNAEKLLASEQRLRALVDNANDVIYTISTESGLFDYISPGWRELLGHDPKQIIGTSFRDYVHPDDVEVCQTFFGRVIATGVPQSGVEYRVKHLDGSWRWYLSNAGPIKDGSGRTVLYVGIARDVTYKKDYEELKEDVERIMRHDLKTPLSGILGLTEILDMEDDLGEEQRTLVHHIRNRGRDMLNLINRSLDLYRIETGTYEYRPQPVDFLSVLQTVIKSVADGKTTRKVQIQMNVEGQAVQEGDSLSINAEGMLLHSVFPTSSSMQWRLRLKAGQSPSV